MQALLRELYDEHRSMTELLLVLDRQVAVAEAGETVDYEIVEAIVEYFLDFPNQCHHLKEDLVYARVRARDAVNAALLDNVDGEHRQLAELTHRFADGFDWMLQGDAAPSGRFEQAAREFSGYLRQHMRREEAVFFPAADRILKPSDWAAIGATLLQWGRSPPNDPVKQRFEILHDEVLVLDRFGGDQSFRQ